MNEILLRSAALENIKIVTGVSAQRQRASGSARQRQRASGSARQRQRLRAALEALRLRDDIAVCYIW